MKYGVNIMVWTTRMNREQEALLSRIKERGFDGVELFLSLNEQANIPEMRRTLHPLGLHRTTSFVLPSDANLSARMPTFEPEVLPSLRDVWSPQGSWTPGTGYTDLERSCSALKDIGYDGWLTIESFAQPEPELAAAAAIWRDLVASGDELACSGLRFIKQMSRETGMLPT